MSLPDPRMPDPQDPDLPPTDAGTPQPDAESDEADQVEGKDGEGEEEEEGECAFCLFMKGGGCKDTFIDWEKCIEEAEKNQEDVVEKCFQATAALKKCMEAHSDYYEPILRAEKAAEEEAAAKDSEERVVVLEAPTEQSQGNRR